MPDSFLEIYQRLEANDEDAATAVFHRFASRLQRLARTRLSHQFRGKVDEDDVVQSVFKSFFAAHADGRFDLANWDSLWALLTLMTIRKCNRRIDSYRAACRDVRRESSGGDDAAVPGDRLVSRDPRPEEAVAAVELMQAVIAGLDERQREALALFLEGHETREVAARMHRSERTIRRWKEEVKERIVALGADDG